MATNMNKVSGVNFSKTRANRVRSAISYYVVLLTRDYVGYGDFIE